MNRFAIPVLLGLILSGCSLLKDPIIGKWNFTPPGLSAGITAEFKEGGTAAYDLSGVESQVAALSANPVVKQVVDRALAAFRSATVTWKKVGPLYEITTTVAGRTNKSHLKLQGDTLTPCDEKGAPRSGAPSWNRLKT